MNIQSSCTGSNTSLYVSPNCLRFNVITLCPPPSLFSLLPPQPPVVKTEMVTISDTFAAQKTEIATKEVPIVHTETKTITYEAAQVHIKKKPGELFICFVLTCPHVVFVIHLDFVL